MPAGRFLDAYSEELPGIDGGDMRAEVFQMVNGVRQCDY